MTKEQYRALVEKALTEFFGEILPEFDEPLTGEMMEEANDELMLAVYEHTTDTRKA